MGPKCAVARYDIFQSAADGAIPIIMAAVNRDAESGDFYGPGPTPAHRAGACSKAAFAAMSKGPPQKLVLQPWEHKILTANQLVLVWDETYSALGETFDL